MKGGMRLALALIASALLIDLVLIQPNHPNALSWRALRLAPLELPVLLLGLLALGRRAIGLAIPPRCGRIARWERASHIQVQKARS